MYESHFGFCSRPFTATPNADRFFPTEHTQHALDAVASCIERATGAALVVGSSGLGKSLLLQVIGKQFQQSFSVAILESASLNSRRELLQCILFELGLPYRGMEEGELRLTLMDYLKHSDRCPNGLLLCVDEAHLLPTQLLEEMRMITNLVRDGQPRARLVLAGNATIEERLADPKLESLNQRISTRAYLEPMNSTECKAYVESTLAAAGSQTNQVFDEQALEAVFIATNGIPRLVNQVCDHALILATANGLDKVTKDLINEAWSDIQRLPVEWHVLGAQTEPKNEHVIEFGSFNDSAGDETGVEVASQGNAPIDAVPSNELVSTDQESESTELQDSANNTETGPTEPEPEKKEFVFEGPTNPFVEKFDEEELIVDTFSQVIGHSPQKPAFPQAKSDALPPVSVNMEVATGVPDSDNELQNDSQSVAEDSATEPGFPPAAKPQDAIEAQSKLEPKVSPGQTLGDTKHPQASQSLDEYLAQSSDAITFGVGQGIYESSFSPIQPVDSEAKRESAQAMSASDQQPEPGSAESHDTESHDTELHDTESHDAGTQEHEPIEEKINQVVSDLREDLTRVASGNEERGEAMRQGDRPESTSPVSKEEETPGGDKTNDDRDMIIVHEDPQPNPVETVPIHEAQTTEPSTQVKREDYQQLFDRLRNG